LNSIDSIVELFEKRSKNYSGRPNTEMTRLIGRDVSVVFSQPGERLTRYRKLLHHWVNPNYVKTHVPVQMEEVTKFLLRLGDSCYDDESVSQLLRRFIGSIALRLAYGDLGEKNHKKFSELGDRAVQFQNQATQPGHWLVNSFPILRIVPPWFPGGHFRKWAIQARAHITELIQEPVLVVQREMSKGRPLHSFTAHFLGAAEEVNDEEIDVISCVSNSFYVAGTDTSAAYLNNLILLIALHPEVQLKAQEELDRVLGKERLAVLGDREHLQYIDCIIMEVHRMYPVAPLLFHSPLEDDTYLGYFIPKGATVYANIWSILNNPKNYPNPEQFYPERFIPSKGLDAPLDPRKLTFGLGRRSCPGQLLGENTVFLTVANALATLNFRAPTSLEGRPLELSGLKLTPGLVSTVQPFNCKVNYRYPKAREQLASFPSDY